MPNLNQNRVLSRSKAARLAGYTWQKSLSYAPTIRTRFVISKGMAHQKDPDPKNPREKQPGVSEEAKVREHVDKLAKGEDPAAEKLKEARDDHVDVTEKIKKKFSRPEQLP